MMPPGLCARETAAVNVDDRDDTDRHHMARTRAVEGPYSVRETLPGGFGGRSDPADD
jgi:hypothetical protein